MAPWKWELLSEPTLYAEAEVRGKRRTLSTLLSRAAVATVTIPRRDPLVELVLDGVGSSVAGNEGMDMLNLRITDDRGIPRFIGPIVTAQQDYRHADGDLAVTAVDGFWRLTKRLLGMQGRWQFGPGNNRVDLAYAMMSLATSGFVVGAGTSPGGYPLGLAFIGDPAGVGTYDGYQVEQRRASDAIAELGIATDGFEWQVAYRRFGVAEEKLYQPDPWFVPGTVAGWPWSKMIGQIVARAYIGRASVQAVWEFGEGQHNVAAWQRTKDANAIANWIIQPILSGETVTYVNRNDTASVGKHGLLMDFTPANETLQQASAAQLIAEHIAARRRPRELLTFTPTKALQDQGASPGGRRVPVLGPVDYATEETPTYYDYQLGDLVRFRATFDGTRSIDAIMRVYGADLAFDEEGNVTPTLALAPQ